MGSFLGVPIVSKGTVVGAFYLTDKQGAPAFSAAGQQRIELLAAHAAIAIDNARLFELTRELSIAAERTRLASELHDAINQTLFSLTLVAEAGDLASVKQLARAALAELRTRHHRAVPARSGRRRAARRPGPPHRPAPPRPPGRHRADRARQGPAAEPDREREVLRVAQEALSNALRHAGARHVTVDLALEDAVTLIVRDDGAGFDPTARTGPLPPPRPDLDA